MVVNSLPGRRRARAEALVDRLMEVLIPNTVDATRGPIIRAIHQARSARKAGRPEEALSILASVPMAGAPHDLGCWVHGEWLRAARSAGFSEDALLYSVGTAQAAVLVSDSEPNRLRVVTAIGLRWEPGKVVSARSLRSLAPLHPIDSPAGGLP